MKIIDFQKGLTFFRTAKESVFLKDLKKILDYLSVPYVDPCCVTGFTVATSNIAAGTGGAIPVTSYLTTINTDAGGDAYTLANGTTAGQLKKILLVTDGGGNGVVTPATAFSGGATTATFNDAGDYILLEWNGAAWSVLENSGVVIA